MSLIVNGVPWYDQNHNTVNSSGGCLVKNGDYFYLFGEYRSENNTQFQGITRYKSKDLENWNYTGLALKKQDSGLLGPDRIGERPKVIRTCEGKYVMLIHSDDERTFDPCVGYAVAEEITDSFVFQGPLLFNNEPIRMWHIGSFTDKDGTNYLLTHEGDIYRLSADGFSVEEKIISNIAPGTEAPAMFRFNDNYFLLVSQKTSWERNDNYYYSSSSLKGPWKYEGTFCPSGTLTYDSQSSFVFTLHSLKGDYPVYMGDRRSYPFLNCTTSVWLPIKVAETKINIPEFWSCWDWSKKEKVDKKRKRLVWLGTKKEDSITLEFNGDNICIFGRTDPHSGYALFTLFNCEHECIQSTKIDFYSQVPNDDLRYISSKLPKGKYYLTIKTIGKHGEWYDKSHRKYGSTDDNVNITGYCVSNEKNQTKISYNSTGFPFSINEIGQNWVQNSIAKPTGIPYYYWIQSDTGEGQITLSDQQIQLKAGQGVLIKPNVSFSCHADTPVWQTSYLIFSGTKVADILLLEKNRRVLYIPVLSNDLFDYIRSQNTKFKRNNISNNDASEIVERFISMVKPYAGLSVELNKRKIAESALNIIYKKFDSNLTNTVLANMTNYSVQYVLHVFNDVYNTTPRRALALYRVAQAKLMLIEHPAMSLREIALMCGFSSETYMIRAFKSMEKLTPGQFRLLATQFLPDK